MSYVHTAPQISEEAFVASNATVIGAVTIEKDVSVWFGAVIRADSAPVVLKEGCNIQDNCTVHMDAGHPVEVGRNVIVGHNAIVHGCVIGDNSMIGMGSILMNGSVVGKNCIIGAGSLVTQNTVIPDGSLALGSPAKVIRPLREEEIATITRNAGHYVEESKLYKALQK